MTSKGLRSLAFRFFTLATLAVLLMQCSKPQSFKGKKIRESYFRAEQLKGADFSGADLRHSDFREADLRQANLKDADLRWVQFNDTDLSKADIRDANMYAANLSTANLRNADLRDVRATEANFSGANLQKADLSKGTFSEATFKGADMSNAKLRNSQLNLADFSGANLEGADLEGANFVLADLINANLRNANLKGADLRFSDLTGADLTGADLNGVQMPIEWDAETSLWTKAVVTYSVGKKIYDIPFKKREKFLVKYPDAIEVRSFLVGGDTYDIALSEIEEFLLDFPEAKEVTAQEKWQPPADAIAVDDPFKEFGGQRIDHIPSWDETEMIPPLPSGFTRIEVDDNTMVKVIENGVVVEKPLSEVNLQPSPQKNGSVESPSQDGVQGLKANGFMSEFTERNCYELPNWMRRISGIYALCVERQNIED